MCCHRQLIARKANILGNLDGPPSTGNTPSDDARGLSPRVSPSQTIENMREHRVHHALNQGVANRLYSYLVFQPDTSLNLVWALLFLGAAFTFIRAERQRRTGTPRARTIRALAVFLAVISLFPAVSASDDSVRFQYLDAQDAQHHSDSHRSQQRAPERSQATLVRMLESLESVQVPVILILSVTLCFFALVLIELRSGLDRLIPKSAGRDPPSLLFPPTQQFVIS